MDGKFGARARNRGCCRVRAGGEHMQGTERLSCKAQTSGAQSFGRTVLRYPGTVASRGSLQGLCFSRQALDLCELQVKHEGRRGCPCPHELCRCASQGPLLCVWLLMMLLAGWLSSSL